MFSKGFWKKTQSWISSESVVQLERDKKELLNISHQILEEKQEKFLQAFIHAKQHKYQHGTKYWNVNINKDNNLQPESEATKQMLYLAGEQRKTTWIHSSISQVTEGT